MKAQNSQVVALMAFVMAVTLLGTPVWCSETRTWSLESYNEWDLPFAKTVEVKQRTGGDHYYAINTFTTKLEIDPSALFSIIFMQRSNFPEVQDEDLRTLNYTYFGPENMLDGYQGVWTDVTIVITDNDEDQD